jgi:hypothetical protein
LALAILLVVLLAVVPNHPALADGGMGGGSRGGHFVLVGTVEGLPSVGLIGDWTVSKVVVHVDASTEIDQSDGTLEVGATVKVEGTLQQDGSVNATQIHVKKPQVDTKKTVSFCGIVESLPDPLPVGDWKVSGVIVHVDASTAIDETNGMVALQTPVRVKGAVQPDLSINATEIVVKEATCGGFNQPASMTFSILQLRPTADAPEEAEGVVLTRKVTFVDGSVREDLKVTVEHLLPKTSYDVMIDSFNASAITTNDEGEGHLFLSTASVPGAGPLPPELQNFATLQQVDLTAGSTVVLTGNFADAKKVARDHPGPDYLAVAILKDDASKVLGMAAASIKGDEQELVLSVWGLSPGEKYTLVVDTTTVGDLTASEHGRIQAEYSNTTGGECLPLPGTLDPVSTLVHVELKDSGGTTVVSGDFQGVVQPELVTIERLMKRKLHH